MTPPYLTSRLLPVLAAAFTLGASALQASMVYYLPFENGSSASLSNGGTAGGTGTAITGISGATAPSGSQAQVAPDLDSAWSEYFPVSGPTEANNRGGAVVLPNSTTEFRLSSTTTPNLMTLSTWVYWNGNAGGTITSPAGIASSLNGSNTAGWSLRIENDGKLKFQWVQTAGAGRNRTSLDSVITAGQWIHTAVVFDSTLSAPVAIYVNGLAIGTNGSSGDPSMGIMKADSNTIALGVSSNTDGVGRQSLNGCLDDFAMWNTALSSAKVKSLSTAPLTLDGYNAGVMNSLFTAFDTQGAQSVDGLLWTYSTGFSVTGYSLGDTWQTSDGQYYMWLGGTSANALGLAAVPEPATMVLLIGAGVLLLVLRRRRFLKH